MMKEIKDEIRFVMEYPILSLFVLGNVTGIIPSLMLGLLYKIFGL